MPIEDEKLYEEIGRTWRHFASWREKAFAGYLTVLAALAIGFSHYRGFPVRTGIFLGAILVSAVFWILDLRNLELMNTCQRAARHFECERGCYTELNRLRFDGESTFTHGLAINLLVSGVGAASVFGISICIYRWRSGSLIGWPSCPFVIAGVFAVVVPFFLSNLANKARTRDERLYRASKNDKG